MPTLYLATNRVLNFSLGHMQVVRQRDDGVIEEIEVQRDEGFIPLNGQWTFTTPVRDHEFFTPGVNVVNGELALNDNYGFVEIQIPEAEIDFVWNILSQIQDQMTFAALSDPNKFNYDIFYNSNTFVNTILSVVGIDINAVEPGQTQSYAEASTPLNVNGIGQFVLPTTPPLLVDLPPLPGASRNALKDAEYPNDAINLFLFSNEGNNTINTGWGNDIIVASTGNDIFDGSLGFDTVDYSAEFTSTPAINNVVASIGISSTIVAKPNGETDTLTNIDSIKGTEQADSFNIDALVGQVVYINGFSPVPPFAEPLDKNGDPLESPDGGRNLSAAEAVAASGQLHMITGDEDTISVSQALFDAGAEVTYLTAQGEGVIWLEQNGVTQMITYTGIFNEVQQTEFFGGLPNGTVTGLNDIGGVVLDFSGSDTPIDAGVLTGITLFNLVDEFIGSDLGDTIDLASTRLARVGYMSAVNDNCDTRLAA